jgi:hypothetical protein
MNGLPAIANNLAAKGRYGDSMLMHVSPGEVKGLQALALANGGSLTINPDTGLPEAFKLKDLLPVIAGAALNFFLPGVGTAIGSALGGLSGAAGTGIAVGGIEALRTGDIGRGLTAGLGAFGGAGLGSAMAAPSSAAAGPLGSGVAPPVGGASITSIPSQGLAAPMADLGGSQALTGANAGLRAATTGASGITASSLPTAAQPGFVDRYVAAMGSPTKAMIGAAGAASPFLQPEPMELPTPEDPYANYKGPYTPSERRVSYPGDLSSSREFMYFDPSNPVPFADGGAVDRAVRMPTDTSMTGSVPEFNYGFRPVEVQGRPFDMTSAPASIGGGFGGMIQRIVQQVKDQQSGAGDMTGYKYDPMTQSMVKMARGGSVPQLEDGGFVLTKKAVDGLGGGDNRRGQMTASRGLGAIPIKGKGHGTSDSIKTSIDGRVPARVSNGEAYVPRRAVKKAGGADKLYALMRKAERRA